MIYLRDAIILITSERRQHIPADSFLFFSPEIKRFWLPILESKPSHNMTVSITLLTVCQILALVGITAAGNHVFKNTGFSIQSQKARIRANKEFPIQQNRAGPLPNVLYWPALTGGLQVGDISLESSQNPVFFHGSLASKGSATKKGDDIFKRFSVPCFQSLSAEDSLSEKLSIFCLPATHCPSALPALPVPPDKLKLMKPNTQKTFASSKFNKSSQPTTPSKSSSGPHAKKITKDTVAFRHTFSIPAALLWIAKRAPSANGVLFSQLRPNQANFQAIASYLRKQKAKLMENSGSQLENSWPDILLEELEKYSDLFSGKSTDPQSTIRNLEKQYPMNCPPGTFPLFLGSEDVKIAISYDEQAPDCLVSDDACAARRLTRVPVSMANSERTFEYHILAQPARLAAGIFSRLDDCGLSNKLSPMVYFSGFSQEYYRLDGSA